MARLGVRSRISKEQLNDLVNRRVTVKALAAELQVSPNYLSFAIPERAPKKNPKLLAKLRRLHKEQIAREVIEKKHTIYTASQLACVSERTMHRLIAKVKAEA